MLLIFKKKRVFIILISIIFIPLFVMAQSADGHSHSHGNGFLAGILHPILGVDHLLAILLIGFLTFNASKPKWLISGAFMFTMIVGAVVGSDAQAMEFTETIIKVSVVVSGLCLFFYKEIFVSTFIGLSAFFGFFHGHAHGVEKGAETNLLLYILGFVIGIIIVLGISNSVKKIMLSNNYPLGNKILGALGAILGVLLFFL